ncbi:putative ribonuclease H protein [Vitis vinifera]|uniref:Putative ribonuclease H protein n=1 Tax=Vitis vinifera TaxID=29760 RepID=A0A438EMY7_VITVI|nr:putative ribonuclease H protein [Vitis vinifera]
MTLYLVMEALSQLLSKAKHGGFISSFKVGRRGGEGMIVSHLLFVNDTLICCEANNDQLRYLSQVFMWYEAIFRLKINFDKSEVIPVGKVFNVENLASVLGCKIGKLPTSYLDLPFGASFRSSRVCLPIYFMSLFVIPRKVSSRLEKIQRDFLYGGGALKEKPHLVNWNLVRLGKEGDLGIRNLVILNKALLGKWCWRFATKRESLWKQIIIGKHRAEEEEWCSREVRESYGVGEWKAIKN